MRPRRQNGEDDKQRVFPFIVFPQSRFRRQKRHRREKQRPRIHTDKPPQPKGKRRKQQKGDEPERCFFPEQPPDFAAREHGARDHRRERKAARGENGLPEHGLPRFQQNEINGRMNVTGEQKAQHFPKRHPRFKQRAHFIVGQQGMIVQTQKSDHGQQDQQKCFVFSGYLLHLKVRSLRPRRVKLLFKNELYYTV